MAEAARPLSALLPGVSTDFGTCDAKQKAHLAFQPEVHLAFRPPHTIYTLEDLGIDQAQRQAPSSFGASEPFPFLSAPGCQALLTELGRDEIQQNCTFSIDRIPCCLRGVGDYSAFIRMLWKSKEVTDIVSSVVGIPLQQAYGYELAHTNVQMSSGDNDAAPVDNWHYDSVPFAAIALLTPTEGMKGGETVLQKGDGSELAFSYPQAGYLIVVQGQHVRHLARRAISPHGRITMVTGYIPADPLLADQTVLRAAKMASNLDILFHQWAEYRLERFSKQARLISKKFEEKYKASGQLADTSEVKAWCNSMIHYLQTTVEEMERPPISKYSDTE